MSKILKLAARLYKKHITLDNFNLYYELQKRYKVSTSHIKKSEELLLIIERQKLKQKILIGIVTSKEFTGKCIINVIFVILILLKNPVHCKIVDDFGQDLNHQPILYEQTLQMIDKPTNSRHLLVKINYVLLIKILQKNIASILFLLSKTAKELDRKIIFLVKAINIAINIFISKAKLSTRSISKFDEKYKNA